jgi:DNA-binding response OmpR family regulator
MSQHPISILLVDDNAGTVAVLRRYLKSHGFEVATAGSVADAIEQVGRGRFEAFVVDLLLPDGSGFSLIEVLRESDPDAVIVALSGAFTGPQNAAATRRAGANMHLEKPCDGATLRHYIASLVEERRSSPILLGRGSVRLRMDGLWQLVLNGRAVDLTKSEHRLMRVLARVRGRARSIEQLRNGAELASDRAVVTMISSIRQKLGSHRNVLANEAGGYSLKLDYGPAHPDAARTTSNPPPYVRKPSPPPFRYSTPDPFPAVDEEEEES